MHSPLTMALNASSERLSGRKWCMKTVRQALWRCAQRSSTAHSSSTQARTLRVSDEASSLWTQWWKWRIEDAEPSASCLDETNTSNTASGMIMLSARMSSSLLQSKSRSTRPCARSISGSSIGLESSFFASPGLALGPTRPIRQRIIGTGFSHTSAQGTAC